MTNAPSGTNGYLVVEEWMWEQINCDQDTDWAAAECLGNWQEQVRFGYNIGDCREFLDFRSCIKILEPENSFLSKALSHDWKTGAGSTVIWISVKEKCLIMDSCLTVKTIQNGRRKKRRGAFGLEFWLAQQVMKNPHCLQVLWYTSLILLSIRIAMSLNSLPVVYACKSQCKNQ